MREFSGDLEVFRVALAPDGKYVAGAGKGGAALWDVSTGHLLRQFAENTTSLETTAFSPDGKFILTGSNGVGNDTTARLWDVETGREIQSFTGHTDLIWTVTFSPDGRYIATASADKTARLWDVQTGEELHRDIGHTAGVENVAFSPDGKYIVTASEDGTARLWDPCIGLIHSIFREQRK